MNSERSFTLLQGGIPEDAYSIQDKILAGIFDMPEAVGHASMDELNADIERHSAEMKRRREMLKLVPAVE